MRYYITVGDDLSPRLTSDLTFPPSEGDPVEVFTFVAGEDFFARQVFVALLNQLDYEDWRELRKAAEEEADEITTGGLML